MEVHDEGNGLIGGRPSRSLGSLLWCGGVADARPVWRHDDVAAVDLDIVQHVDRILCGRWIVKVHDRIPQRLAGVAVVTDLHRMCAFTPRQPDTLWRDHQTDYGRLVACHDRRAQPRTDVAWGRCTPLPYECMLTHTCTHA